MRKYPKWVITEKENKMKHLENGFMTMGSECEIGDVPPDRVISALNDAGINGVWVTTDISGGVSAEIVFPPLPMFHPRTKEFYEFVYRVLDSIGAEINTGCGHHVSFSTAQAINISEDEFFDHAINLASSTDYNDPHSAKYPSGDLYGDPMSFELVKDVVYRYGLHQRDINRMLPDSRHDNSMCYELYNKVRHNDFDRMDNVTRLSSHLGGKFAAINLSKFDSGIIEFRQHAGTTDSEKILNWVELIHNMFQWSDNNRLSYDSSQTTPEMPYRRVSKKGVAWALCRTPNGATVQDIMDRVGWTAGDVRRTISEFRSEQGSDDIVQTISQLNNGASHGDGPTHTRYIIRETLGNGISLLPDNQIGQTSIFAGLSDDCFEYMQQRIITLGH